MNDLVMTIREVAQVFKLADKTFYATAMDGELPVFRVRGQWRVRRADFEAWLADQLTATRRELTGQTATTPSAPSERTSPLIS